MFAALNLGMARTQNWLLLSSLMMALTGCVAAMPSRSDVEIDEGNDEVVVSADSAADDPYGFHNFSYVGHSILLAANTATEWQLINEAEINFNSARAIMETRATGYQFQILEELDDLPGTGRSFFNHMRDFAASHGMLGHCGDGIFQSIPEQCDDGNNVSYDGCSATCDLEPMDECHGRPTVCGDGFVCPDEVCDDGNTTSNDGCSSTCELSETFTSSSPNFSVATAADVPAGFRTMSGSLERAQVHYFIVHVTFDANIWVTQERNCTYGMEAAEVDSNGNTITKEDGTYSRVCAFVPARPGTHIIAVRDEYLGTAYEGEPASLGEYVLNIGERNGW